MQDRDIFVGLRAEDKSYWERRTPLPPTDCKHIMDNHPRIQIVVQPSSKRVFPDSAYKEVGCVLSDDLTNCELIVCIKEIPIEKYIPGKTYLHWSHTIKAQEQNMPALDAMIEKNIRHIDYEKILDEKGVNITAFPYAGIAGAITLLSEYGKHLLRMNVNTPFLSIGPSYQYYNIEQAYKALKEVGENIKVHGFPEEVNLPLVIGVLGSSGRCGQGSMQALLNLPVTIVQPDDLKALLANKDIQAHKYTVYVVPFQTKHLVRWSHDYDLDVTTKDYYEEPNKFTPVFHSKYLPYISLLLVDIYWENKFPRYVTNTQMKELVQSGKSRLQAVGDVTCDLEGAIQFLKRYTSPQDPIYYYDPITEDIQGHYQPEKQLILYMAIDFLPSQLPYDSSLHFGQILRNIVPEIAYSDPKKPLEEQGLPQYLQDAVITCHGKLTQKFEYINHLRRMNEKLKEKQNFQPKKALKKVPSYQALKLIGHLFDRGVINKILDLLQGTVKFNIVDIHVGQSMEHETSAVIQLYSKNPHVMEDIIEQIRSVGQAGDVQVLIE